MANASPIIYSQHLRCLARLLKNPTLYSVFTFLFDEYLLQVRKGLVEPIIRFNQSQIANNSGVNRGEVAKYIVKLEELGLVTLKGKRCKIHSRYLLAVSQLFYQTTDNDVRELICDAFRANQRERLEAIGLELKDNADAIFGSLTGGVSENRQFQGKIAETVGKPTLFDPKLSENRHFLLKIREMYGSKEELENAILSKSVGKPTVLSVDDYVTLVFDDDYDGIIPDLGQFLSFTFDFCLEKVSENRQLKCRKTDSFAEKSVGKPTPEINRINKKRNNNESEPESEPEEEVFEGFDSFKVIDLIKPDEENSQEGLRKGQEPVYPFLPVEQVEEIVNNIEVAKQSSFRLFLFNLWGYASDMTNEGYDQFPDEEDEQETFSETEEEFFDPEGCLITRSDYRQLLLESYEQTQADIEKGEMEYGDETLSLSLTEMFPRNLLFKILDWKETAMSCKESSVIISKAGIRNIEAEELSSVEQPKTREEKRQAAKEGRELMTQLHAAKQDSNLYSQLTPIEKIAADMVDEYFQPNPDKESRDPFVFRSRNILTKDEWRVLKFQMVKAGVKVSEFLGCLLNNDGPNDGDQLSLQMPMFYAEGIRHWNEVHQETSAL